MACLAMMQGPLLDAAAASRAPHTPHTCYKYVPLFVPQVACLAMMVGPRVAAAAASRALEVMGEDDPATARELKKMAETLKAAEDAEAAAAAQLGAAGGAAAPSAFAGTAAAEQAAKLAAMRPPVPLIKVCSFLLGFGV